MLEKKKQIIAKTWQTTWQTYIQHLHKKGAIYTSTITSFGEPKDTHENINKKNEKKENIWKREKVRREKNRRKDPQIKKEKKDHSAREQNDLNVFIMNTKLKQK